MQKLLNEWRQYLQEGGRVVKPTEGTPEALRKSRKKGLARAAAKKKALDDKCAATIAAIGGGGEDDIPNQNEMACIKNRGACKRRCVRCRHKGDWMSTKSKCQFEFLSRLLFIYNSVILLIVW